MKINAKFERFTENGANFVWYRNGMKYTMWLPLGIVKPTQNTEPFTFYVNTKTVTDVETESLLNRIKELEEGNKALIKRLNERELAITQAFSTLSRVR